MTTRATPVASDRVRALNSIDIVFRRDNDVVQRWREYLDTLSAVNPMTEDRFIELLFAMGNNLGFKFDKVMLKRGFYNPQSHVDAEVLQIEVQKNLNKVLVSQQETQLQFRDYLDGKKPLRVELSNSAQSANL